MYKTSVNHFESESENFDGDHIEMKLHTIHFYFEILFTLTLFR